MSFAVGKCEINGQKAELQAVAKFPPEIVAQGVGDMDGKALAYLLFIKEEKGWRFDGFNSKRMVEDMLSQSQQGAHLAEPFKPIADLAIAGKTVDDQEVSLASYKGKVVLIDFWGTWCGPRTANAEYENEKHPQ